MMEELHKLLETHERLVKFPLLKNIRAEVERQINALEAHFAPKVVAEEAPKPRAIPAQEPEPEEVERRI